MPTRDDALAGPCVALLLMLVILNAFPSFTSWLCDAIVVHFGSLCKACITTLLAILTLSALDLLLGKHRGGNNAPEE